MKKIKLGKQLESDQEGRGREDSVLAYTNVRRRPL